MEKNMNSKPTLRYIVLGVIPVLLLTVYFSFLAPSGAVTGKPNTPNVLMSEKNSAVNMTARNSWYITMLLRKVELSGRMANEVISGVLKRQNAFFTQDDYRKIKTDSSGKYLTSSEKENGALFICGGYKSLVKDAKLPVIGSYLDNTLALVEKNGAAVESVYIMTEAAVRKYPWVKTEDLVKAGLFKLSNYKIRADSLFVNEDASPYSVAGPRLNKGKQEIWTDAYWSSENKAWMITYLSPIYVDGLYKGVLGVDISLQKLLEKLIGRDQSKKFTYADTFPVLITKNGILAASSIYGYEMLKLQADNSVTADLKAYGTESFKSALSNALVSKFWDNATSDEELGGMEVTALNKADYYMAHFPVRTGGLTLVLFIPAANLEKSAAVSVTTIKGGKKGVNKTALFAGLICAVLASVLMAVLAAAAGKGTQPEVGVSAERNEDLTAAFAQEKKVLNAKLAELTAKGIELEKQLEKTKSAGNTLQPDLSKYIPIAELNGRVEAERKILAARILELEKGKEDAEKKFNDKTAEYRKLLMQNQSAAGSAPVDLSKYIPTEEYNAKIETERKNFIGKVNELEKQTQSLEEKLKEANIEKVKLNERLAEAAKTQGSGNGVEEQKRLVQRLGDVQKANDNVRGDFEQLKRDNEDLIKKLRTMEKESRDLAGMLIGKFDEEKKSLSTKIEELNKQINVGGARVVELENKIKTDSVKLAQMDPSKFVPLAEVNTKIEVERKNYVLKIQELENKLKEMQDPLEFVPMEKVREHIVETEKKGEEKIKELEEKVAALAKYEELAKQEEVELKEVKEQEKTLQSKLQDKENGLKAKEEELLIKEKEQNGKYNELLQKMQETEGKLKEFDVLKSQLAAKDASAQEVGRELAEEKATQRELVSKLQEFEQRLKEVDTLQSQLVDKDNKIKALEGGVETAKAELEKTYSFRVSDLENRLKAAEEKPVNEQEYMPVDKVSDLVTERLEAQDQKFAGRIKELEKQLKEALKAKEEATKVDLNMYVPADQVNARLESERNVSKDRVTQLESAVKALNSEKETLAKQLAEVASSKEAAQRMMATVGEATKRMEEDKAKAALKVKELENVKLELEQKYLLLDSQNRKMQEALTVVEGRKKETDKQAQSLIQQVGQDQQALKEKIKESEATAMKMQAERDAAMRQYEKMKSELEKVDAPVPKVEQKKELVIERRASFAEEAPEENNAESVLKPAVPVKEAPVEVKPEPVKEIVKEVAKVPEKKPVSSIFAAAPLAKPSTEHSEEEENNVLVVDDQGDIIKIFGDSLYNMGFSVYIARNAKLAKQKLTLGNYRNVILSVNLLDGDYKELYESLKKADSKLADRIIFYGNDPAKDPDFLTGKKLMKSGSSEAEIKGLLA